MIIGVSGYGATGASAVLGVIKECKDIQSYSYGTEFQLLQQPDGILDLYYYLVHDQRRLSVNTALQRFQGLLDSYKYKALQKETHNALQELGKQYLKSLIQVSWSGYSAYEANDLRGFIEHSQFHYLNSLIKKIGKKVVNDFVWPPDKKRYYSGLNNAEFISLTHSFLYSLFQASNFDLSKPILLEQLFPPTNPSMGAELFDDSISIVVERDPRDLYILTNYLMPHLSRFMPNSGNVYDFIKYYKGVHSKKVEDISVEYVQFEDFVYNYNETREKLLSFLHLSPVTPRTLFIPEDSINNTCLYENYENLTHDITTIEKELSDYLYPFENYKDMSSMRDIDKAFVSKPGDTVIKKRF